MLTLKLPIGILTVMRWWLQRHLPKSTTYSIKNGCQKKMFLNNTPRRIVAYAHKFTCSCSIICLDMLHKIWSWFWESPLERGKGLARKNGSFYGTSTDCGKVCSKPFNGCPTLSTQIHPIMCPNLRCKTVCEDTIYYGTEIQNKNCKKCQLSQIEKCSPDEIISDLIRPLNVMHNISSSKTREEGWNIAVMRWPFMYSKTNYIYYFWGHAFHLEQEVLLLSKNQLQIKSITGVT